MQKKLLALCFACLFVSLLSLAPACAQEYTITDLGAISTTYPTSHAVGISPSGQYVTGDANTNDYNRHMFLWTPSGGMNLPSASVSNWGYSVNNLGHIAGQTDTGYYAPCYYDGISMKLLSGTYSGAAYAINSHDTMCGQGMWSYGRAFWASPSTGAISLGKLPGSTGNSATSAAYAINDYGKIVGASAYSPDGSNKQHAFLWTPTASNMQTGSMVDIHTTTDYLESYAKAIDAQDNIAGFCWNSFGENNKRAFYKPATGPMQILPGIAGPYPASEAIGINNSGMIVGSVGYLNDRGSGACFASRWVDGQMQLLNDSIDLRSAWNLDEAAAVDNLGQIVGTGTINRQRHGFLLTPITDPTPSPTPHIDSVSPMSVHYGSTMHVYGTGFTEGSVVVSAQSSFVYPQRISTTYISSTQLDVVLPVASITSIWVLNPRPGGGESNHFSITVAPNNPPTPADDVATTAPYSAINIDVLANDFDPDGDALTLLTAGWQGIYPYGSDGWTQMGGTVSIVTVDGQPMVHYTPPVGVTGGTDQFIYRVSDSMNLTASATVTVNIDDGSLPPAAAADSAKCLMDQSVMIDVLANDSASDLDDYLTITSGNSSTTQGGTAYLTTSWPDGAQSMDYNPPQGFTGTDTFTYTIANTHGKTSTATVTVEVFAHWPPTAVDDSAFACMNTPVDIDVLANDSDPDPDVTISVSSVGTPDSGGTASIIEVAGKQCVQYQPAPDFTGTDTFTYTIANSSGEVATATVTVNVINDNLPLAVADSVACIMNQCMWIDVLANDTDADPGDTLTIISGSSMTSNGGWVGVSTDEGTGKQSMIYCAPPGFLGTDTFDYTIADGQGVTSTATVTITVFEHYLPVAVRDSVQTSRNTPVNIDVLANDRSPEGAAISISSLSASLNGGAVSIIDVNGLPQIQYQPSDGFMGIDTFDYTIVDTFGGTATATVTVDVIDNNPPVAINDSVLCIMNGSTNIDVLANDGDVDSGDTISIISGDAATSQGGSVYLTTDGETGKQTMYYYAPQDFVGTDSFEYTIADSRGATSTATVAVNVAEHLPPIAVNDDAWTDSGEAWIYVMGNDYDPNWSNFTITSVGIASHGTASVISDSIFYRPDPGFAGTDTFDYTITNDYGLSATATVTVNAIPIPPVAGDDSTLCCLNTAAIIDVLSNDIDRTGATISISSVDTSSQGGTTSIVDVAGQQRISYQPPADFTGTDTFTYTISNIFGLTATATVTVDVINDGQPVAVDDSAMCLMNGEVSIDVLANDNDPDPDDTFSIVSGSVDTTQDGMAYLITDGETGKQTMDYYPAQDFVGTDTFQYTIADSQGVTSTATVTVDVIGHSAPVAVEDSATCLVSQAVTIDVLANDSGDTISISSGNASTTQGGTAYLQTDGATGQQTMYYCPAQGFLGADTFEYTIADSQGSTSTATVTLNVVAGLQITSCSLSQDKVAAGDKIRVTVLVLNDFGEVSGVTADGVPMQQTSPGQWEAEVVAGSTLGLNHVAVEATGTMGQTQSASLDYQVYPVYGATTRSMYDPIMEKMADQAFFALCGKVAKIDDSSFWLDDGGKQIKVICTFGQHGLSDGDMVRARGLYSYSSNPTECYLTIALAEHISKQ